LRLRHAALSLSLKQAPGVAVADDTELLSGRQS
jgi:hypothetical protein